MVNDDIMMVIDDDDDDDDDDYDSLETRSWAKTIGESDRELRQPIYSFAFNTLIFNPNSRNAKYLLLILYFSIIVFEGFVSCDIVTSSKQLFDVISKHCSPGLSKGSHIGRLHLPLVYSR